MHPAPVLNADSAPAQSPEPDVFRVIVYLESVCFVARVQCILQKLSTFATPSSTANQMTQHIFSRHVVHEFAVCFVVIPSLVAGRSDPASPHVTV